MASFPPSPTTLFVSTKLSLFISAVNSSRVGPASAALADPCCKKPDVFLFFLLAKRCRLFLFHAFLHRPAGTLYTARITRFITVHGQQQHTAAHSAAVPPATSPSRRFGFGSVFATLALSASRGCCRRCTGVDRSRTSRFISGQPSQRSEDLGIKDDPRSAFGLIEQGLDPNKDWIPTRIGCSREKKHRRNDHDRLRIISPGPPKSISAKSKRNGRNFHRGHTTGEKKTREN
ncbi:hypothetical protein CJ030_MR4G009227 [Morella rubra]|uniref:Uncharacterized protein n=1 Tax=Morella rubra TaxID=262757 RepID=A0A6A1VRZ4_9ROSI|nr:hypothetical protein CJ030_MR4G009227 [Morella rubra]